MFVLLAAVAADPAANGLEWRWYGGPAFCQLIHRDSVNGAQIILERNVASDRYSVNILSRARARPYSALDGTIRLSNGTNFAAKGLIEAARERGQTLATLSIDDPAFAADLPNTAEIEVSTKVHGRVAFQPTSLRAALDALKTCSDAKLTAWGVDPIAWRKLGIKPQPLTPVSSWIDGFDYPDREKNYANEIVVVARLDLDASGTATECKIVSGSKATEFNNATCALLLKRARLTPARDQAGQPVASPFFFTIGWAPIHI